MNRVSADHRNVLTRRALISGGVAATVAVAVGSAELPAATPDTSAPITKIIPSSGERAPVVGIGTNRYSVSAPEDVAARRDVLRELPNLGGKIVDTAWGYGDSEVVIGNLVRELGNRERLFIATKTPSRGELPLGAGVVEQALSRLQTARLDLLQIHNFYGIDQLYPALLEAKQAGKVRYVGVTTSSAEQHPLMREALQKRRLDFIQVDYSIEDRRAEDILQTARDKGVAVLVNVPLGGRRGSVLTKVKDRPLPDWAGEIEAHSWAQLLLKYTIAHPAVTAVIPGTTQVEHLRENQLAGRGRLPNAALRKRIEDLWSSI
jgi:aryl-alcohol dehydrogenase-like predicted oxidoreductase